MIIRVEEIVEQDSFSTQHGELLGWKFRATDLGTNETLMLGVNTKPTNHLTVGQEFDFEPSGKVVGIWTLGKRAQNQAGRPNPYGGGQRTPPAPASPQRAANAPQAHSQPMPTIDERAKETLALLPRAIAGVTAKAPEGVTPDGILQTSMSLVMHLLIGKDQGRLRDNPSAAQLAAEKAEADRKAAAALAEAQRVLDEAAARAPGYAAGEPQAAADGTYEDIPF